MPCGENRKGMDMEKEKLEISEQEKDELIEQLNKIFSIVRMLKEKEVAGFCLNSSGKRCYEFWGKDKPCENCTSYKTLSDHKDRLKFEYLNGVPYQILSKYVKVDGKDSVIEILKELDSVSVDPTDARLLSTQLFKMNDSIYRDALTGTLNRTYYEDNKNTKLLNAGTAFIDVDNFKEINDTWGHTVGDRVLQQIGSILLANVREKDAVIRYGGDEFVIVILNITKDALIKKLEDIKDEVVETGLTSDLKISVSCGGVIFKEMTVAETAEQADKLMYEAKKEKNTVIVKVLNGVSDDE